MKKILLYLRPCLVILICMHLLPSCQNEVDTPIINCPDMVFNITSGGTTKNLNLSSSVLFRQQTDSGGRKYLSMEALNDSMKIIININDGIYPDSLLMNDTIQTKTYLFSQNAKLQGGLVVAGIRVPTEYGYNYLQTDTSSVTITRINPKKKTVTGYYYFRTTNNVQGQGVFQNTCYLSLTK